MNEVTFTDQFTEMTKNFIKHRLSLKGVDEKQVHDVLSKAMISLFENPEKNRHIFLHLLANLETAVILCYKLGFTKDGLMEEVDQYWARAEKTQLNLRQEFQKLERGTL